MKIGQKFISTLLFVLFVCITACKKEESSQKKALMTENVESSIEEPLAAVKNIERQIFSTTVELLKSKPGKLKIRFTVKNLTESDAKFCTYHTPFEGIRNHIFELIDEAGVSSKYQGIMAKRRSLTDEDFITLSAGEEESIVVEIENQYALPKGKYRLNFKGGDISRLPDSSSIEVVRN